MKRRVFSFVTALALCLNLCPSWAFAAEDGGGLCPHHRSHTDACGYVPEDPGAPCTFECRICPIEEQIAALPDSVTADNGEQAGAQLDEIFQRYNALTEEEQAQVDLTPCAGLMEQLEGLDAGALTDVDERVILNSDKKDSSSEVVKSYLWYDTNGHTYTNTSKDTQSAAILVTSTGRLELMGTVISDWGIGVKVEPGGTLTVMGENTVITAGKNIAIYIASGVNAGDVQLSAGTYSGNKTAIFTEDEDFDFSSLLAEGCAFFDADGNALSPDDLAAAPTLTVKACTDHQKTCTHDPGAPTHTWTCAYCGASGTEPCTFDFVQDGVGTSACAECGHGITIDVNQGDLSNLVYDGTVKPEQVRVTVTLADGTVLTKGTDFEVVIDSITNAGQATVTVTGITFNGEFVKTYSVEKAEPGIRWNDTSCTVDYDGKEVDNLPGVTITAVAGDDLSSKVRYAYQKTGDTAFTDGLPTNAGAYQVKAYLEESDNYKAMETDQLLTLTINPIAPITAAPEAKTLTYNRSPQALVTAGTLDPVAEADGLTIEFATAQDGPWSTTVPTGTNAGDYTVWYQVTGLTGNYIAPNPNPAQVSDVKIQRKAITPVVKLSPDSFLYDGGEKQPAVSVLEEDGVTDLTTLRDIEYKVEYVNNRNVSTDDNPAKVVVSDAAPNGGNYDIKPAEASFKITLRTQEALSITNQPSTFTYGDRFTLGTSGGSGNGLVTWEITSGMDVAEVDQTSGQVTITGHGSATVKATKSGKDPATNVVNYEDATATWTFTADKKPVTATVTAEDKTYDGDKTATVNAVVEGGILPGDEIKIEGLTGTFDDENAGENKTVSVDTTGAAISGHNSQHYAVSYSAATVKASIHKAVAKITTPPVPASLTYNGTAQALIATGAVVDTTGVPVEYSLSETGPYSTDFPEGTNAGTYTVWYRVQETPNYTGLDPVSVDVTIGKKPVNPTITLDQNSFIYDGAAKEPVVTLKEADGTTIIPVGEYTVAYSDNINYGTATVTVTAKDDGNYSFENAPVTANFTIGKEQARVLTAPEALELVYNTKDQKLVTAGTGSGGTMVYRVGTTGDFESTIPTGKDAAEYTVHYKVQGDTNHSDSAVGSVKVTIAPKTVKDPTIELYQDDGTTTLVSYTYDGSAKEPKVVVKDGSTVIADTEYNIVYSDNTNAGHGTVNITANPGGNYTVTGAATFLIDRADIEFNTAPAAADHLSYDGTAQELLVPGTITGNGTVYYALDTPTSEYHDYIPTGIDAGDYKVYYKVVGDRNHNDYPITKVDVTIARKPLTTPTIELTPSSFQYDGAAHLPAVTVKDGNTVLPEGEYTWKCTDSAAAEVTSPIQGGTYTITISDAAGGNYDLSSANPSTATFTIGKAAQAELVIEGKREHVYYGDTFPLTTSGGDGTGSFTWSATGNATIAADGTVTITGVGEFSIGVVKSGDTNYQQASAHWTFTAAPKPVTASVTVNSKPYDGTTDATVATADIAADLVTGDTVTIDPASITAAFDDPHAGAGKTVTLDSSKVQVTGDAAKYAISYPATVTAEITQATTAITTAPEKIDPLTYNEQPQALVTAGVTNVGFLVYSLDAGGPWSADIPTGTDAGDYSVYYKVDETGDYTGVTGVPINVAIAPKNIKDTVKIELSETSYVYDGAKKSPKVTLKDGDTVIPTSQYTVTWANADAAVTDGLLTAVGAYRATIKNVTGGNYIIDNTAEVHITPATQASLHITGQPEHVYYGDTVTSLNTTGGTGEGTLKWSVTVGDNVVTIDESTGVLTAKGVGPFTVKAERTVPNYGTAADSWTFTVEPKPVTAAVTVQSKDYDGGTTATVASVTVPTINSDTVTVEPTSITATFDDPNAGTGKTVTLDSTGATATGTDAAKYTISYPATATGDINPKNVTVTVTLSDHDLTGNATDGYYYEYDGTEKEPKVTVKYTEDSTDKVIPASNYTVKYSNNKNVSTATEKAAVTVTAKDGGNYTFTAPPVNFAIRKAAAGLTSSPQAKDLTYEKGTQQELVTVGTATGGTVVYALKTGDTEPADSDYSENIPKGENAGTYTVYYMVKGDSNHESTAPQQMTATIKPKEITPTITLSGDGLTETNGVYTCTYDGTAKTPTVTVKDGTETIDATEYTVSYRDNINVGTATVTVSDANGGNYIVNGTATFQITKKAPTVTAPTAINNLQYNGELQELVTAGVCSEGTVEYSVNGGNYSTAVPSASAVDTYSISWKVQGDANHSDTAPATLTVKIDKNTVTNPTISLSQNQFTYDGNQHAPTITVYDDHNQLIPQHEYTAAITGVKADGTQCNTMVDVATYTVKITTPGSSNYVIADDGTGENTREFKIVPADQESISITGTPAQVHYGDVIQLGVSGGTGAGTITWTVTANDGSTIATGISSTGLLTVKDVGGPCTVTVTRTRGDNYTDVSASWEFSAGKKPVTAEVTAADRNYAAGDTSAMVTATVPGSELVSGDSITITGLTGQFDDPNVGTDKRVTVNSSNLTVTGTNWEKYDITYPATATASILGVAATVDTEPVANTLTYDASQSQALVTAGSATGGTMVYSLDGKEFTPNLPKGKDAGTYTVYYKAQGDQNHTDSEVKTVNVTIDQLTVTPQIELSPPSAQYDGSVKRPSVTVRDAANNVIPDSEYTVVYDPGTNWKDVGKHKVKVQNITGGNYIIADGAEAEFEISTSAQAPLEIVNKPGLVTYGDTFTLSTSGGSSSQTVTWSSSNTSVADIDANGFVTIKGTGPATITATKAGGGNYDDATATYPLNALQKPVTAIVTAEDREYVSGDTSATIHVTWKNGDLVGTDTIRFSPDPTGTFDSDAVGTNKQVTVTATVVENTTALKYDITIPATTTASITKAAAAAPVVTANTLTYDGTAQNLVTGGDANTLYASSRDGVYTAAVPTGTNAGAYTVWYKAAGDANHDESAPQAVEVTISPKTLTADASNVELTGNDLKTDANGYYYEYDGTEKTPSVVVKDGAAAIPAREYTLTYSDNKNVTTADKKAAVIITDNEGGNYTVSGSVSFEIRAGAAQLTGAPQDRNLTYNGAAQQLVTVGTATGGYIEYQLTSAPTDEPTPDSSFSTTIPTGTSAGAYTVDYKLVGDTNHTDGPTGSVTVTIQPKTVVSPTITVDGGPFTYKDDGTAHTPTVTVVDGTATIPASEYTLSYQNNVNAGTATVIVTDNNGGNYTVNGTATFEIGKAAASVGTAPTGKDGLHYTGAAQALLATQGTATGGTMVYALSENGEYSAAIPTGTAVGEYEIWYKVQGDANHSDSTATALSPKVKIDKNTVTNPTIQVTPASVKFTGEKQEPTVTVKDDDGLPIDGSEYTVAYADTANGNNSDLIQVGTYTVTVTAKADGNYIFNTTKTATFAITPADQNALTITGTRERVTYGDTIPLGTTGGIDGGTVTWKVGSGEPASIDASTGLLKITGVGSVTVTATSTKTGYADQSAAWNLYADKKQVTALVTAASKTYDGDADADVTATLQTSDFVGTDSFTVTLTGCTFEDPNAGTDKKVNVVSTNPTFTVNAGGADNHGNYAITYPATATASIFKADIKDTDVTAPEAATGLEYTGLPQELITAAGTATGGTMEYSTDGINYSAVLPTGTNAGDYDVWYRVKGDGNHKDTVGTKLGTQVTIARQTVTNPTIEFTPDGATFDNQEHKPTVRVLDAHGRVIPDSEYTVSYGSTNWKDAGDHTLTITGKTDGNYSITGTTTKTFTILPAGQSPLSIVGQPGTVQYGDVFTLSASGGSGTGAVTWASSDSTVAFVNSATGRVEIKKAGGPVTITAKKAAGGGYGETTATWTFSAEKRPATAIVTAKDRAYDASRTDAELVITWKPGDLLSGDSITLNLTGAFDDANVGTDKTVRITGTAPNDDRYAVTFNTTTTASITAQAATVSGVLSGPWEYTGSAISLLQGGTATNGTIIYSRNGVDFIETSPTETDAGRYTVYYKARGNTNFADSDVRMVEVTIQPKTVNSPTIELSQETFTYDGTAKEPDVVVKDGTNVIPASEYTVSYRNNTAVGTATVTISDNTGGNYTVSGSKTFTITAGAPALVSAPEPKDLTYNGFDQALVTPGTAANGSVVYATTQTGNYSTTIPTGNNAGFYQVWYKAKGDGGETTPESMIVEIKPRTVTPSLTLSSTSLTYTGSALTPAVTVSLNSQTLTQGTDYTVTYSNNTEPGTATVTVTSIGGNYQFTAQTTFTIAKAKAAFLVEPEGKTGLVYTGQPQELIEENTGLSLDGIVLYSTDAVNFSATVPTATKVSSRHLVIAKVQGNATHADSDPKILYVEIAKNDKGATVTLESESANFPYTGSAQRPPVTVLDSEGNVIDSSEYTLSYSDNISVGTATVTATSKTSGNYSFTASTTFTIVDASQTPLAITGKQDTVTYGDTLSLGTTGGGSGTVTWSSNNTDVATIDGSGVVSIKKSGSVTITATKGGSTDTWTFVAQPKPVTATVYAADKVYDGNNTATLTVALSGLVSGDNVATNTEDGVKATGQFTDTGVGTRTVIITLTVPAAVSEKYNISCNNTTTASITPKPASVTGGSVTGKKLTYNGTAQGLIDAGGVTAEGGNLAYSLDGNSYTLSIPTATDVGSYPIWYKVVASSENYKDGAPVKVTPDAVISANQDTPQVRCDPGSFPYDGTEKKPTVVVMDSTGTHIIPESEYTVSFSPSPVRDVGKYSVTVTDKPGGSYQFTSPVTVVDAFEIVTSSQAPVSITDKPANVHYGDTFYLSATGGSGSGDIQWSVEGTAATINSSGAVTVTGTGSFTVKAYRAASGGYSDSNTDSVTFVAQPKPVTPVVTAEDKSYNGNTDATLTASIRPGDKVNASDDITLTAQGVFASADAGVGKRVDLKTYTVGGTDAAKYTINWPDSVTATINRVDAKITAAPTGKTLTYSGYAQELVSAGTASIGTVVYSLNDQNGTYSQTIPTATAAGTYTVWYKVADSVNFTGVPAASVTAEIQAVSTPPVTPPSEDTSSNTGMGISSDTLSTYSTPARTTVRNGAANTVLSTSEGASLVRQAAANQSQNIVIQPEVTGDVTRTQVTIPASTASQINSQTDAALTVASPIADVTIPNGALDTLSSAGGSVNVAAEQKGDAVTLTLSAGGETVESVPGGVTLTVPVEDATPGTVAVLVGEDGTRQVIQRSVAKDGAVSVPLDGSATVEIVDNSKDFEDVPAESWALDAITFASARELFQGTSETTFSPDETMSRGMVTTVLYRLEGQPDQAASGAYSDVDSEEWYAQSVAWAAENGIVSGYGDGQFGPNDSVTREQFIVMLWRYLGSPEAASRELAFSDADQAGSYAVDALCWAVESGILRGNGSGQLNPSGTATRAEVAQMLKDFLENT